MSDDVRPDNSDDDDRLARTVAAMRNAAIPDGPSPRLLADTLLALREAEHQTSKNIFTRILTMKPLTKIAASILLAFGLSLLAFVMLRPNSVVWADVVDKVAGAKALAFTAATQIPGTTKPMRMKFLMTSDGLSRIELPDDEGVTIMNAKTGETLTLNTKSRLATLLKMRNKAQGVVPADPIEAFKQLKDKGAKDLGEKEIDGRKVKGFSSSNGSADYEVWADKATGDPVRIDWVVPAYGGKTTTVMTDFSVNPQVDPKLFDTTVPPGYKLNELPAAVTQSLADSKGEDHVVAALKGYAERTGGKFPKTLEDWSAFVTRIDTKKAKPDPDDISFMAHVGAIAGWAFTLPKDGWAYLGENVKFGEKDKIVFWYQDPKTKGYRAIYGDLSVKDVSEADVPRPAAKP